jgi:transposase
MISETLDSLSKKELIGLVLAQAEQIAALQSRVAELEAKQGKPPKTPDNSSLPPSQGQKANRPEGANKQRRKGRKGTTRGLAEKPDHTRDIYADKCGTCSHELTRQDHSGVHAYDHIDIPPFKAETTRVNQHKGRCPCCGAPFKANAPPDMPPGSPFGPNIIAIALYLRARQMVSYNRLVEMMKALFGLDICEGAIANMLERAAAPFAAEGANIEAVVRGASVIASDETSARVMGHTCWQWVFSCETAVSHRIAGTRAKAVVEDFLGGARPQVWVSDRYGGQMGHGKTHQACLAHILRDAQYAIDCGDKIFAPGFKFLIKRALAIGRRRHKLKDGTLENHKRDLKERLARLLRLEPSVDAGCKLRRAMGKARDMLFVFVTRRDVPPTNNISERLLRMSVIFRKVTGCFRSEWRAGLYADILSVMATAAIHHQNALDAIRDCLKGKPMLQTI